MARMAKQWVSVTQIGLALSLCWVLTLPGYRSGEEAAWQESIHQWRAEREAELHRDDGWLAILGLYWLRPGDAVNL